MGIAQQRDPLNAGFFSVRSVSVLLDIHPRTIKGWLDGYKNSKSGPMVARDFKDSVTISFLDLMELRFIEFFRSQKVSTHTIRLAAERARSEWRVEHPFALSKAKYLTDRRRIFAQIAEESGDKPTWEMASGQHEMWEVIESIIAKGVEFDPNTQLALSWKPRLEFPDVVVDPKVAFGSPVIERRGVPTSVLFKQWKAEGRKSAVADWFNVSEAEVETAVDFELSIAA